MCKELDKVVKEVSFSDLFEYLYFKPAESTDSSALCEEVNRKLKSNWTYKVGLFYFGFHDKITTEAKLWEKKDLNKALIITQSSEELPNIYSDLLNSRSL